MEFENMAKTIKDMKAEKSKKETEIENIKSNIIKTKNDFYKTDKNYSVVENKYKVLDSLFDEKSKELNNQLKNMILKTFNKIVSKKVNLETEIKGKYNDNYTLALNNRGIGTIHKSYWRSSERINTIEELETLITILKDETLVNRIKRNIHKTEKKEMLDVLHEKLKDWSTMESNNKNINLDRKIIVQERENSYNDKNWDVKFKEFNLSGILLKFNTTDRLDTNIRIKLASKVSGDEYDLYQNQKENYSSYNHYDESDKIFASCQI